jgi:molybdenum cofactor cytidylyltransferase
MPARLTLAQRLNIDEHGRVAFVGSGGKTSAMFALARDLPGPGVLVTTTTHLAIAQAALADRHVIVSPGQSIQDAISPFPSGVTLISGMDTTRVQLSSPTDAQLKELHQFATENGCPVLLEADGSRFLPIKAPADHEPRIPDWSTHVVVVTGLSGLHQPLDATHVHRPEIFSELSGLPMDATIQMEHVAAVLTHKQGGLKNIQVTMTPFLLINQADSEMQQSEAGRLATLALPAYHKVMITSLSDTETPIKACFTHVAGIILAAGESRRFAEGPKALLDWQGEPFVRRITQVALAAGLEPVVVVTGANQDRVAQALEGLPVDLVHNTEWEHGQSTSIRAGFKGLAVQTGAAIFLLADQPQITEQLLRALVERHRQTSAPVVAPMIEERRGNPVLFDQRVFRDLQSIEGDTGGRAVFSRHPIEYLDWLDAIQLIDVDTVQDYINLKEAYASREHV